MSKLTFAVDFDGTCVTHSYPEIGKDIGAVPVLKDLIANGHRLVLFTMRSGETLDQAVQWFKDNDIPLFGINRNPTQDSWTQSPKAYANMYIDDAAVGAPLLTDSRMGKRPYMNWAKIREIFEEHEFIKKEG